MSLFRPGAVPPGLHVERPVWPALDAAAVRAAVPFPTEPVRQAPAAERASLLDPAAAEAILNQARLHAADILQQAAVEADAAVVAARQQGYEDGRREGVAAAHTEVELQRQQAEFAIEKAQVQAEALRQAAEADARAIRAEAEAVRQSLLNEARQEAHALLSEARQEQCRYLDEAQSALVELAVAAAMRLVQGHLAIQPGAVVAMVAAGLRRLKDSNCTVRVNPQDLPLLHAQRSVLERELGAGSLRLQPDSGQQPGGYVIASPNGQIDGSLDQQVVQLRTALTAALGGD